MRERERERERFSKLEYNLSKWSVDRKIAKAQGRPAEDQVENEAGVSREDKVGI